MSLDFLEGLKRAQRSRLEDQRGTEINFELPDFLKDKENNLNNKFRNAVPPPPPPTTGAGVMTNGEPIPFQRSKSIEEHHHNSLLSTNNLSVSVRPQPAPRLSINSRNMNNNSNNNNSKNCMNRDEIIQTSPVSMNQHKTDLSSSSSFNSSSDHQMDGSFTSVGSSAMVGSVNYTEFGDDDDDENQRGPPPLPPKPKILPIKPSNWGQSTTSTTTANTSNTTNLSSTGALTSVAVVSPLQNQKQSSSLATDQFNIPKEWPRRLAGSNTNNNNNNLKNNNNNNINENEDIKTQRNVYLDQPSSSFV